MSDFIGAIAEIGQLSLFVGAGTSIESGFPDWTTLVSRLLATAAIRAGLDEDESHEFAGWTISRDGLTGAAAVAESTLGVDFPKELHHALYAHQLTPPPGQSAHAAARLACSVGLAACDISTTNYDLILESALGSIVGTPAVTAVGPNHRSANSVLHLHGAMRPRGGIAGRLVLSERDYFLMQEDSAWQQQYFSDRLASRTCVFVGASLTDPNLLRYLYRSATVGNHYAIFIRQQDAGIYNEAADPVVGFREATSEARWQQAGIKPLHVDFFSQSAQLLYEILHRRERLASRRVYHPLPTRLDRWRRRLDQGILTRRAGDFDAGQNALHQVMQKLLGAIRADLADAGHRPRSDERLGISMWVYDPRSECLTNWASADRVWRDPSTMEPLPVDWTSDFVSVQAFCAGSLVSRSTERYVASRWNHVIGAPLYVETQKSGRLPVGAVTIASTLAEPQSALHRGLGTLRRTSLPTVEKILGELLQPDGV